LTQTAFKAFIGKDLETRFNHKEHKDHKEKLFRLAHVFVFYVLFVVKSLPNLSVDEAGRARHSPAGNNDGEFAIIKSQAGLNSYKINYRIHTDAIKETLIPSAITKRQASLVYRSCCWTERACRAKDKVALARRLRQEMTMKL
jgi:hypothetical protein